MTNPNNDIPSSDDIVEDTYEQPTPENRLLALGDFEFERRVTGQTPVMVSPYGKEITVIQGCGQLKYIDQDRKPVMTHLTKGGAYSLATGTNHRYISINGTLTVREQLVGPHVDLEPYPTGFDLL